LKQIPLVPMQKTSWRIVRVSILERPAYSAYGNFGDASSVLTPTNIAKL
jgi:hypothetical protein